MQQSSCCENACYCLVVCNCPATCMCSRCREIASSSASNVLRHAAGPARATFPSGNPETGYRPEPRSGVYQTSQKEFDLTGKLLQASSAARPLQKELSHVSTPVKRPVNVPLSDMYYSPPIKTSRKGTEGDEYQHVGEFFKSDPNLDTSRDLLSRKKAQRMGIETSPLKYSSTEEFHHSAPRIPHQGVLPQIDFPIRKQDSYSTHMSDMPSENFSVMNICRTTSTSSITAATSTQSPRIMHSTASPSISSCIPSPAQYLPQISESTFSASSFNSQGQIPSQSPQILNPAYDRRQKYSSSVPQSQIHPSYKPQDSSGPHTTEYSSSPYMAQGSIRPQMVQRSRSPYRAEGSSEPQMSQDSRGSHMVQGSSNSYMAQHPSVSHMDQHPSALHMAQYPRGPYAAQYPSVSHMAQYPSGPHAAQYPSGTYMPQGSSDPHMSQYSTDPRMALILRHMRVSRGAHVADSRGQYTAQASRGTHMSSYSSNLHMAERSSDHPHIGEYASSSHGVQDSSGLYMSRYSSGLYTAQDSSGPHAAQDSSSSHTTQDSSAPHAAQDSSSSHTAQDSSSRHIALASSDQQISQISSSSHITQGSSEEHMSRYSHTPQKTEVSSGLHMSKDTIGPHITQSSSGPDVCQDSSIRHMTRASSDLYMPQEPRSTSVLEDCNPYAEKRPGSSQRTTGAEPSPIDGSFPVFHDFDSSMKTPSIHGNLSTEPLRDICGDYMSESGSNEVFQSKEDKSVTKAKISISPSSLTSETSSELAFLDKPEIFQTSDPSSTGQQREYSEHQEFCSSSIQEESNSLSDIQVPGPSSIADDTGIPPIADAPSSLSIADAPSSLSIADAPGPSSIADARGPSSIADAQDPSSIANAPSSSSIADAPRPSSTGDTAGSSFISRAPGSSASESGDSSAVESPKPPDFTRWSDLTNIPGLEDSLLSSGTKSFDKLRKLSEHDTEPQ